MNRFKRFMVWVTALRTPLSSLSQRILLFNLLLVFLPIASFIYLDLYEKQLLEVQEKSMVQQARLIGASLKDTGKTLPDRAKQILTNLEGATETRLRIISLSKKLIVDSSTLYEPKHTPLTKGRKYSSIDEEEDDSRDSFLYRLALMPIKIYRRIFTAPLPVDTESYYSSTGLYDGWEIRTALEGQYGAVTRLSGGGQQSVTLYTALPIWEGDQVAAVVLASQSTYRILQNLYELRLDLFKIILLSSLVAFLLTAISALTITKPLTKLTHEAASIIPARGSIRGKFSQFLLKDEVGKLSRSLEDLRNRLEKHVQFVESFGADVNHEFKNPLAGIKSAVELLPQTTGDNQVKLQGLIEQNLKRLTRLTEALQDYSRVDKILETEQRTPIRLDQFLEELWPSYNLIRPDCQLVLSKQENEDYLLYGQEDLIHRIFSNLLGNALSYSPEGGKIYVEFTKNPNGLRITITDEGPGIPSGEEHKIFQRFYSSRKDTQGATGLGLSMVKNIVEAYEGSIRVLNREKGACFELTFYQTRGA